MKDFGKLVVVLVVMLAMAEVGRVEAQSWIAGQKVNCGSATQPGVCLSSGPGCLASQPPGRCVFPPARAEALCRAHPQCQAVTCVGPVCEARQNTRLVPDPNSSSLLVPKATRPPAPTTTRPAAPTTTRPPAPRTVPRPRAATTPKSPPASPTLRQYLADFAGNVRQALPQQLESNIEATAIATRCSSGCDAAGPSGIMFQTKFTDFDSMTMPSSVVTQVLKPRLDSLSRTICADAQSRNELFGWGIDVVLDLVDRNDRPIVVDGAAAGPEKSKFIVNATSCGQPKPVKPAKDQIYEIGNTRGCLDIEGKSVGVGAWVVSAPCDGSRSQAFQFRFVDKTAAGQDIWWLVNSNSNLCVTVAGGSVAAGGALQQTACAPASDIQKSQHQWFRWLDQNAPFYQIGTTSSMNLDVTHGQNFNFVVTQQSPNTTKEQFFAARSRGTTAPASPTPPAARPSGSVYPPNTSAPPAAPTPQAPAPRPAAPVLQQPISAAPTPAAPTTGAQSPQVQPPAGVMSAQQRQEEAARQQLIEHATAAADLATHERSAQVQAELDELKADFRDEGLEYVRYLAGDLRDGEEARTSLGYLDTGYDYFLDGFCDQGCTDLDLEVVETQGGSVANDSETDAHPALDFRPPNRVSHTAIATMVSCWAEPCKYRAVLHRAPLQDAAGKAEKDRELQEAVRDARSDFERAGYSNVFSPREGELVEGGSKKVSLGGLTPGRTYVVAGVCDDSCTDFEIELVDSSGADHGFADGSDPEIEVTPTVQRTFSANVTMHSCGDDPCKFSILVMKEP